MLGGRKRADFNDYIRSPHFRSLVAGAVAVMSLAQKPQTQIRYEVQYIEPTDRGDRDSLGFCEFIIIISTITTTNGDPPRPAPEIKARGTSGNAPIPGV